MKSGIRAPEFSLRELAGGARALADTLRNGPAVLAFFKVSCPVCQLAFPFLERLYQSPNKGALQFFAISQDDDRSTSEFLKQYGVTMPALLDEKSNGYPASNGFEITHVPSVFVVEQDGTVSHAWDGFSKQELERLGARAGAAAFRAGEDVPAWKAG